MRERLLLALMCAMGAAGAATAAAAEAAAPPPTQQDFALIERGRYLSLVADCAACHTDPKGGRPFAGGRAIDTPFGSVLAPNITPDRETGIGGWSDAQFDAALRQGKMPDGKDLYPGMPYVYYSRMSRADVLAVRAYLNTVEPVHHDVVSDQLPFPFNVRAIMGVWNSLYFKPGEFQPVPTQSAQWNRGAYLVQGPGHCAACHTPKNALGGDQTGRRLEGYAIDGWFGPNITNDAERGLARWSVEDVVEYLAKGHNRWEAAAGPMAEEIADSSSRMRESDLRAIALYLKDQPGRSAGREASTGEAPLSARDPEMVAGAAIYRDLCSACHQSDGRGVPYLIPSLAGSSAIASRDGTTLVRLVLEGARSVATDAEPTAPAMPGFGSQLSDEQAACVLTYIRNSWSHAAPAVAASEVHSARATLAKSAE